MQFLSKETNSAVKVTVSVCRENILKSLKIDTGLAWSQGTNEDILVVIQNLDDHQWTICGFQTNYGCKRNRNSILNPEINN